MEKKKYFISLKQGDPESTENAQKRVRFSDSIEFSFSPASNEKSDSDSSIKKNLFQ